MSPFCNSVLVHLTFLADEGQPYVAKDGVVPLLQGLISKYEATSGGVCFAGPRGIGLFPVLSHVEDSQ